MDMMPAVTHSIHPCFGVPVMQEKNKGVRTRKEKTKLSLFTMIWLCW